MKQSVDAASEPLIFSRYLQLWRDAMKGEAATWMFIAKALLALYIACWLAMRLEMPQPSTVMITVLIVMNPSTGMVLAKAFYRAVGTLIGCVAGVVLVALFPQQPLLLLIGMALWTACMAAGALVNRNMRAYSFVLGGYTVAMIVLPSVNNPQAVFDTAIWRFAEVGLGLIVTGCVFDILFPNRLHQPLKESGRKNYVQLLEYIAASVGASGAEARAQQHAQQPALVRAAVGFEELRSLAYFDDPSVRANSPLLAQLNQRYMNSVSRYFALQHFLARQSPLTLTDELTPVTQSLQELAGLLARDDLHQSPQLLVEVLVQWQRDTTAMLKKWRLQDADNHLLVMGESLLQRFCDEWLSYLQAYASLDIDKPHGVTWSEQRDLIFARATDPLAIALTMLRAGGVMFVIGLIWIASGWENGATALFGIVALLSMLSSAPNPVAVTKLVSLGHIIAPVLGLAAYSLLPILPNFPLLVLGTLPFMIVILYIGTRPGLGPLGIALNMGFMVALMLPLAPNIQPQFYLNEAVAISVGVTVALLSFLIVPSVTGSRGQRRRLMWMLRAQIKQAARVSVTRQSVSRLRARFESRSRDILLQVINMTRPDSIAARRMQEWALVVHEAGLTIIDIRAELVQGQYPQPLRAAIARALEHLSALYGKPAAGHWHAARSEIQQALQLLPAQDERSHHLHQLLLQLENALEDGDSVLLRRLKNPGSHSYAA